MNKKIILTKQKIDELKEELLKLEGKRKKDLSETLQQARLNDVSEDTDDVIAVMNELQKVNQKINEIKETLANAITFKKNKSKVNKVEIGSSVKIKNGKKSFTYHIVSEIESNPVENKISDKSPLGKALLKAKIGDTIKIDINGRKAEYKILSIS